MGMASKNKKDFHNTSFATTELTSRNPNFDGDSFARRETPTMTTMAQMTAVRRLK